jgi:hypothetical protein
MYEWCDLTESVVNETPRKMGRTMLYPVRITLPLAEGVTERLDALVVPPETRLDIIREAIEREIKRRTAAKPKS